MQEHIAVETGSENVIEDVETLASLDDVVDRNGGVERTVRGRIAAAWSK